MEDYFSRYKQDWSKPVTSDDIKYHLSTYEGEILCGIDKRFPGVYNAGSNPIENIEQQKFHICTLCYNKYKKLNQQHL